VTGAGAVTGAVSGSGPRLLARTAVHLTPRQAASRARLRAQRRALARWPGAGARLLAGPDPARATGWPAGFVPLDGRASLPWPDRAWLDCGKIELLGMARELGEPADWQQRDAPRLWRFHLHYWDWAWSLAAADGQPAAAQLFARLWRSWQESAAPGGDAWLPYPAALRAWSWCGQYSGLVAGTGIEADFVAGLARHAGFLRRHLEYDVGGNHLIKGLKALAGLAVFFADDRLLRQVLGRLTRQLAVQVLPDGGHFERAPAYHCQVLADLIDVSGLLAAAAAQQPPELDGVISRMRAWLGAVLTPGDQVPLLNDGYPVPPGLITALEPGPRPGPGEPLVTLPDTGLVRASAAGWQLLADVGAPCPAQLPAHAHADTLGCLLHADGIPLLVDTGTSTYERGPVRQHERSTAAHSTVTVDGADSTEVWGAFRAGRRARVRDFAARSDAGGVTVEAAHDGFRHLPGRPVHRRRWLLTADGLTVDDRVTGTGRHAVVVRWVLAPGTTVAVTTGGAVVTAPAADFEVAVSSDGPVSFEVATGAVAGGFLQAAAAPVLTCRAEVVLPAGITTSWRRAGEQADLTEELT